MTTYSIKSSKLVESTSNCLTKGCYVKMKDGKVYQVASLDFKEFFVDGVGWLKKSDIQCLLVVAKETDEAVPLPAEQTQERMFTLDDAIQIYEAAWCAHDNNFHPQHIEMKNYFQSKFNIDITHK